MDKLNDVSRGEYPLCAETIEVLNDFSNYINAMFDGLMLPARTAICMQGFTYLSSYMYVQSYNSSTGNTAFACKVVSNFDVRDPNLPTYKNLINNPGKYSLADRSTYVDVQGNSINYEKAIYIEQKEIVLADENNPGWTFYMLEDLYQRRAWRDITAITLPTEIGVSLKSGSKLRYDRFNNTLDIQLDVEHGLSSVAIAIRFQDSELQFPTGVKIPLNATAYRNDGMAETVPCIVENHNTMGPQIFIFPATSLGSVNGTVIRGTVALK